MEEFQVKYPNQKVGKSYRGIRIRFKKTWILLFYNLVSIKNYKNDRTVLNMIKIQ